MTYLQNNIRKNLQSSTNMEKTTTTTATTPRTIKAKISPITPNVKNGGSEEFKCLEKRPNNLLLKVAKAPTSDATPTRGKEYISPNTSVGKLLKTKWRRNRTASGSDGKSYGGGNQIKCNGDGQQRTVSVSSSASVGLLNDEFPSLAKSSINKQHQPKKQQQKEQNQQQQQQLQARMTYNYGSNYKSYNSDHSMIANENNAELTAFKNKTKVFLRRKSLSHSIGNNNNNASLKIATPANSKTKFNRSAGASPSTSPTTTIDQFFQDYCNHNYNQLQQRQQKLQTPRISTPLSIDGRHSPLTSSSSIKRQYTAFAGSLCFEAPDPKDLPKPPVHWSSNKNDEEATTATNSVQPCGMQFLQSIRRCLFLEQIENAKFMQA